MIKNATPLKGKLKRVMSLTKHNAPLSRSDFSQLYRVLLTWQAPSNGVIQCPTVGPCLGHEFKWGLCTWSNPRRGCWLEELLLLTLHCLENNCCSNRIGAMASASSKQQTASSIQYEKFIPIRVPTTSLNSSPRISASLFSLAQISQWHLACFVLNVAMGLPLSSFKIAGGLKEETDK